MRLVVNTKAGLMKLYRWVVAASLGALWMIGDPAARAATPVITNPDWIKGQGPTLPDMMTVYPEQARRKGLSGMAKVKCIVTVEGKLDQCVVLEETPADGGFGQAALSLLSYCRMHPRTVDGVPTGGATVVIPLRFALPPR